MLDKVKNAVSNISKIAVEKQISEKELDRVLEKLTIELLESEIPFDLVEQISCLLYTSPSPRDRG